MVRKTLAFLRWELTRWQRRIGWSLWGSALLLLVAGGFSYQAWKLGKENLSLIASNSLAKQVGGTPRPTQLVDENGLKTYYDFLPYEEERFFLVKRLLLSADKNGVLPSYVEYKLEAEKMTKVVRYQLTLPLKGDFSKIKNFLIEVLNENRSITIDSISLKRESIDRSEVEAKIQFSILMVRL